MFKLQKENVIKVVDSSLKRDKLVNMGFALVQTPVEIIGEDREEELEEKKTKTPVKLKSR